MNNEKEIRCLLVVAPFIPTEWPLIGLPYLASAIKNRGYSVSIEDLSCKISKFYSEAFDICSREDQIDFFEKNIDYFKKWVDKIIDSKINVVGFTAWNSNEFIINKLSTLLKKRNSNIFIVCGGPDNCGTMVQDLLFQDGSDIVVHGEGENTFLEILDCFANNKPIDKISGISYLDSDYCPVSNPKRPEIKDINNLCFPDFSDLKIQNYKFNEIPLLFSRGCQWRCKFCSVFFHWNKFRTRSAKNIFEEILLRMNQYNREQYVFQLYDCAVNQDLNVLEELCDKIISLNLPEGKIVFKGNAKIMPQMNYEFLKKMKMAGFRELRIGIESGSDNVLKLMSKPFYIKDAERIIVDASKNGIELVLTMIVGFPGETEKDWDDTINFLQRVSPYVTDIFVNLFEADKRFVSLYFSDIIDTDYDNNYHWMTKDLTNTYDIRKKRMQKLDENMKKLPKWSIGAHGDTKFYSKVR